MIEGLFPSLLKQLRLKRKLTQSQVAELAQVKSVSLQNLDTVTLSRWERGVTIPTLARKAEIVALLGEDLFDLLRQKKTSRKFENILTSSRIAKLNKFQPLLYASGWDDNSSIAKLTGDQCTADILFHLKNYEESYDNQFIHFLSNNLIDITIIVSTESMITGHLISVMADPDSAWGYLNGELNAERLLRQLQSIPKEARHHKIIVGSYCGTNKALALIFGCVFYEILSTLDRKYMLSTKSSDKHLVSTLKECGADEIRPEINPDEREISTLTVGRSELLANRNSMGVAIDYIGGMLKF
jgi:transcriptional regulator with XRE-family HTH domain